MKNSRNILYIAVTLGVLLWISLFVVVGQPIAPDEAKNRKSQKNVQLIPSLEGADLYHSYCATCHGDTGKGDGPVASVLETPVPDLTKISKTNGGIFPADRVRRIIAGDELIKAHGTREMPVWGPIFHQIERDRDYGHIRLQNVTKHVESLQEK